MNLKKALLAGAALVAMVGTPAQASIVDNPHFRVLGLVIVWSGDASGNPVVNDFVIGTGSGGTDLIDDVPNVGHTVVTGSLTRTATSLGGASNFDVSDAVGNPNFTDDGNGVLDAADTFDAFQIDDTTDVSLSGAVLNSSFFVASNTAFNIVADADLVTAPGTTDFDLESIGFEMSHTNDDTGQTDAGGSAFGFGGAANASIGSSAATVTDLGDIETAATVFTGSQRTAASAGTIIEQSVRFDVTYTLGGSAGYDLSMGAGDVEADVTYTVFVP